MLSVIWLRGLTTLRMGRLAAAGLGVAIAVALLASLGSFLAASQAKMTARSIQRVAVDWQVQLQPGANAQSVRETVRTDPRVATAVPVGYARTTGLSDTVHGSNLTTGGGRVLGLPPSYEHTFPSEFRYLTGAHSGALLAQQTAANLHARPGQRISIGRAGLPPITVRVAGIVALPHANSLFQKVGAPAGAQPTAPPDNVVLLPAAQWHAGFDRLTATRPDQVTTQWHVRTRHTLPSAPSAAYTAITGAAHHLEARLAGGGIVGDNLGAALGAARGDAAYATLMFLFLGLPGAVLAALLTGTITASGRTRRRGEQALLRTRGAGAGAIIRLALAEGALVGTGGAVVGLGAAAVIGSVAFGSATFGSSTLGSALWAVASVILGVLIAAATGVLPVLRDLRVSTVASARAPVGRVRSPRWQRYGLDLWLLLGFAVVFYFTSGSGYHLVLAPEGIPSISVSYWAFAGPVLLWLGAGLLTWRLVDLLMHRGRPVVTSALRPVAGALAPTAAATLSRQRRLLARTVVLVVLAIAFAGSTAIFNATYQQQARADAQLTNGADVTATLGAGTSSSMSTRRALAGLPGVASLTSMQHRYAYVGPDLQDLYGVHPKVIAKAVHLQDAYFQGGTAAQLMGKLAAQPDAILVSAETVRDYQLHPGDLLKLRLPQRHTQHQVTVPFHYVGVVKEFPTAPKDSFFVANADYVSRATDGATAATYLITTGSGASPSAVAGRVRSRLGPTAKVTDIQSTRRVVGSSLTAVDLGGLTRVELGFALLLAAGATGLLLVLGFTERRRTFALLRALGARPRELGALVRAEVGVVVVLGAVFGAIVAWALAEVLVAVLTGVFDPPPDQLAVPWPYLAALGLVGLVAAVAAGARVVVAARRPALEVLRDL